MLALLPACEGRGIGKRLLTLVQGWLFASGRRQIWLVTEKNPNFRAYGFYQALGWRPTGEVIDGDEKFVLSAPGPGWGCNLSLSAASSEGKYWAA